MPASLFSKDEKVLCFHHEILYDAKILEVRPRDPGDKKSPLEYRVHYKGWKNTWDDWVLEDRLRKATDDNRELAASIRREVEASTKKAKPGAKKPGASDRDSVQDGERGNSVPARGTKRGRDTDLETEEQFYNRPSIRFPLSDNLKSLIVDDWERVSKNATVVALPAPRPVRKIWSDYCEEEESKRTSRIDRAVLHEVHVGLLEYFDVMLDKVLLYNYERPQYRVLRGKYSGKENCGPIDIYGAEHFLRLLSILPELFAQTNMSRSFIVNMREEMTKFCIWLSKNSDKYFRTEYVEATDFY